VRGINRYGRAAQGVRVMNLREGDEVSAVALVVESAADEAAGNGAEPAESAEPVESLGEAVVDGVEEGVDGSADDGSADADD
jgi:DNA gyrase subunit A